MMMKVVRFIAFYGSWIGSVYSPQTSHPSIVSYLCLVPLLVLFFYGVRNPRQLAQALALVTVFGIVLDSVLQAVGYFEFPFPSELPFPLVPLWYFPLWIGFGCSMIDFEPVFRHRLWLAALLGSVGGPLSFIAGAKLGAITIVGPLWVLSFIWILVVPTLCLLIRWRIPSA